MSKQNKEHGAGARVLDVFMTLALLAGAGFGCYYVASRGVTIDQTTTYASAEPTDATEAVDPNAPVFESVEAMNTDVHTGDLILVNNTVPCQIGEEGLVSLYEKKLEAESSAFSVRDGELLVQEPFADAIIDMMNDFYAETGDDNLLVLSGYRSQELQQQLYDEDLAATGADTSTRVAKPGFSEHQTGYGIDLSVYDGDYDGTGIYAWIDEHCAEYGIVLRYPEDKQEITDIQFEPWHYRYVGKPHAAYMMQNDMVLEEYLEMLQTQHPYEGEHLMVTDTDGKVYEIYYYAMDEGYDSTMVAVPSGKAYTISGNNTDGFIVTVETGDSVPPDAAVPAEETVAESAADAAEPDAAPAEPETENTNIG